MWLLSIPLFMVSWGEIVWVVWEWGEIVWVVGEWGVCEVVSALMSFFLSSRLMTLYVVRLLS